MKKLLIFLIKGYQKHISPFIGNNCRFIPSCSCYAIEALERYGPFKGTALAVYRVLRCNPFCKSGYDPVPLNEKRQSSEDI